MPPGMASPYHVHHSEDEAFYVLDGHVRFVCDGEWMDAGPGTWVYGPREIPHGFKVVGAQPARMLLMCAPAGLEKFVLELCAPLDAIPAPPDMAKLAATAARFNIGISWPAPGRSDKGQAAITAADAPASLSQAVRPDPRSTRRGGERGRCRRGSGHLRPGRHPSPPGQPDRGGGGGATFLVHTSVRELPRRGFRAPARRCRRARCIAVEHGTWKATFTPKDGSRVLPAGGTYLTVYARLANGSVRMLATRSTACRHSVPRVAGRRTGRRRVALRPLGRMTGDVRRVERCRAGGAHRRGRLRRRSRGVPADGASDSAVWSSPSAMAAAADDLVQQVLLTVLEALRSGGVRESGKLPHFVLGTCRMTVLALRRVARRQERLLAEFRADLVPPPPPVPQLDGAQLASCIQRLKERERSVVVTRSMTSRPRRKSARLCGSPRPMSV